ncbi:hypothetical protein Hanom_Chr03g00217651 [Helianthus anomalus]
MILSLHKRLLHICSWSMMLSMANQSQITSRSIRKVLLICTRTKFTEKTAQAR